MIRKGAPIILLLLLASQVLESQELLKPVLKFTNACASNSFNMYDVEVTYIAATFNSDNTFTLELSDASGDFSSPTAIKTISNQNNTFRFTTTFSIPQNTAGSDYKIRVKSSSPEKISPESDAFEAYFMSLENIVLNNFENVTLCEGESKEISVATSTTNNLQWYKNGQKFTLGGTSITVDEPGLYYCEIYYGACNSPATSNIVEVNIGDAVEAKIIGDSNVYLCENESYTLEASVSNNLYTYSWFKDGVKINNLPAYTPSINISNAADFGTYSLEITNEFGCSYTSNEVSINNVNTNFSVNINTATPINILSGETKVLSITHDAQNAEIIWYKNNIEIPNSNSVNLNINEPGTYFATVKSTVNNCSETKTSDSIIVNNFKSFEVNIGTTSNYTTCVSTSAQLQLELVKAIDVNDVSHGLTNSQIALLNFKWFKNNLLLNGATNQQINVNGYENNGDYFLEVSNGAVASNSNHLDVNLKLPEVEITSNDSTYTYCDNKQITLTADVINGLNYQWYLNNTAISSATNNTLQITQAGVYHVELSNTKGCISNSNEISITNVNSDFSININSSLAFILSGETKVLEITHNAQNAEINWFKNSVQIPNANTTSLTITEPGIYYATVKNTVNGCSETKTSESMIVSAVEGFNVTIKTLPDYSECTSTITQLLLESVKARDVNQNIYDLTNDQISLLNFNWYKNNNSLNGFSGNQITINSHVENGNYSLEISNGTVKSQSNTIAVKLGVLEPVITSNDHTNTYCDSKQIRLSSTQQNGVSYQWFLNGSAIANATGTNIEITTGGLYQIEVTNQDGCSKKSSEFTIENFDSDFAISTATTSSTFILAGETKVLNVSHNAQNAEITWFKDNVEIPNSNTNNLNVTEAGVYYAQVEKSLNGCSETKTINAITVSAIDSFTTIIKTLPSYSECSSLQTNLFLDNIQAKDTNGTTHELSTAQIALLEFKWYKDNNLLNGFTNSEITINNYEENGSYFLEIINGSVNSTSNTLEVKLGLPEINVTSIDNTFSLCSNKEITLSTAQINGLSYQWFFNDLAITGATNPTLKISEVGNYRIETTGFSCNKTSQEIIINSFDGNSIEFNFDDEITIQEGESIVISASGADTYEWFDENDNIIETSSSIEINKAGNYRVIAYLNGCSVEKLFTVIVISGNIYVPNILTPNGDGVNDSWKIPAEFAFKNNIEVEIISIGGRTVLKQKNYQNNWPENDVKTASLYFYIIRDDKSIIKKGTINIIK